MPPRAVPGGAHSHRAPELILCRLLLLLRGSTCRSRGNAAAMKNRRRSRGRLA